jgi:hypothetical protein
MDGKWMGLKPQLGPQFLFVGSFPFGRCLVILTGPDWSKEDSSCPKVSWAPRQVGPAARLVRSPPAAMYSVFADSHVDTEAMDALFGLNQTLDCSVMLTNVPLSLFTDASLLLNKLKGK